MPRHRPRISAQAASGAGGVRLRGSASAAGVELLDARFERVDARVVFGLQCLQFRAQARDIVSGCRNCRHQDQRQQRRQGLKLIMEFLLPKPTNTRASAGVELLVDQRKDGGARERNAEKARCGTWADRVAVGRGIRGDNDGEDYGGRAARHVLHRGERHALAAELALRGRGVRIGFEVRAGVHHHAELGKQQRQRQHMHEPTAIASNQNSLRG